MIFIGIDPGKTGGVALVDSGGNLVHAWAAPLSPDGSVSANAAQALISTRFGEARHIGLEKAQAMPGQGSVSMFTYGKGYGKLVATVELSGCPYTLVQPRQWTKVMHEGCRAGTPKERSLEAANRLFPGVSFLATDRSRKPHEGMIDAALIALYLCWKIRGRPAPTPVAG